VIGIVDGHPVQQEKILVRSASPHIDPAGTFCSALHPGHELNGFNHIGLSHEHGNAFDFLYRDVHRAHLRILHHILGPVGGNHHLVDLKGGVQGQVPLHICSEAKGVCIAGIANIAYLQVHLPRRQGQTVVTVFICGGSLS